MPTRKRLARYKEILTEAQTELLADPSPRFSGLEDSVVFNTFWTAREKAKLFTALARCGKGHLEEIVRRVGSKSLVEVATYIGILDEESERRREQGRRGKVLEFEIVPAAVEVDDSWLEVEERYSSKLARKENRMEIEVEDEDEDEDEESEDHEEMIYNVEGGNELASWYASMFRKRKYNSELPADTIRNLDTLARTITKQLLNSIFLLVSSQIHSTNSSITIPISVARTAIDLLSLPGYYRDHFTSLPSRMQNMGVRINGVNEKYHEIFEKKFGHRGRNVDVAEYMLNRKTVERQAIQTLKARPEKWSYEEGFDWYTEPVDAAIENDMELEVTSQSSLGSETTDEEYQELDEHVDSSSSSEDDGSEDSDLWDEVSDEDLQLLDAETAYLDSLDLQYSQIEQQRLHLHVDQGKRKSRRFTERALNSVIPNDDTVQKKSVWDKARKRLKSAFGREWDKYSRNVVDFEGEEWERPPERWELFRKRNPVHNLDIESSGMRRSGIIGKLRSGRKRKIEEIDEEDDEMDDG